MFNQKEYLYILTNPSYPSDLLKIGMTTRDPSTRARELSRVTGVPTDFVVAYAKEVIDARQAESKVHNALSDYAYNKEFFKIDITLAIEIIEVILDKPNRDFFILENQVMLRMFPKELNIYESRINQIDELRTYIEEYTYKCMSVELDDQQKRKLYFSFSGIAAPIYSKLLNLHYTNIYWSRFDKYNLGCNVLLKKTNEMMSMMNELMRAVVTTELGYEDSSNYFYYYIFELLYNANEGEKIEVLKRLTFENNIWLASKTWLKSNTGQKLQELLFSLINHKNIIISMLSIISLLHIFLNANKHIYCELMAKFKEKLLSLTDSDKFGVIAIIDIVTVHTVLLMPTERETLLPFFTSIMNHCTKYNLDYEASCIVQDYKYITDSFFEYQKILKASVFFETNEQFTLLCENENTRKYIDFFLVFLPLMLVPY